LNGFIGRRLRRCNTPYCRLTIRYMHAMNVSSLFIDKPGFAPGACQSARASRPHGVAMTHVGRGASIVTSATASAGLIFGILNGAS
jgi:hypothetical protein